MSTIRSLAALYRWSNSFVIRFGIYTIGRNFLTYSGPKHRIHNYSHFTIPPKEKTLVECILYLVSIRIMGNCIILENLVDYGCGICYSELGMQYIYCPYCHHRFHQRCVMKYKRIHIGCPCCKQRYLRFIDKELSRNKT